MRVSRPHVTPFGEHGRKYSFTIVSAPVYRGVSRYDTVFIASGCAIPFVARVERILKYTHDKKRHLVAYVKYFEDVPEADTPPQTDTTLHYRRLRVQAQSPLMFVRVSSIIEPANVVPNFDDPVLPRPPGADPLNFTLLYNSFFVNDKHFPATV